MSVSMKISTALVAVLLLTACHHTPPKVAIQQADRAAYTSLRAFQVAEEQAWHAKAAWPDATTHQAIGRTLSGAYTLVIDVAQAGLALQDGQPVPTQIAAELTQLTTLVADLVRLATKAPADVQAKASDARVSTTALVAAVKGGQ